MASSTLVFNALNEIAPFLPAQYQVTVNMFLTMLTVYFHVNPSQQYNNHPDPNSIQGITSAFHYTRWPNASVSLARANPSIVATIAP